MLNRAFLEKLSKTIQIDADELEQYNRTAYGKDEYIGKVLAENEVMPENDFQMLLAKQMGFVFVNKFEPLPDNIIKTFSEMIPYRLASKHMVFPYAFDGTKLSVAAVNPWEIDFIEEISRKIDVVLTTSAVMMTKLQSVYERSQGTAEQAAEAFGDEDEYKNLMDLNLEDNQDLLDSEDEEPIKKLVNSVIFQALRDGSSDIHADPSAADTVIRERVDGVLHAVTKVPKYGHMPFINRIKVMAGLDISTKNRPQDGRTLIRLGGRKIDIRVSILPTVHGERAVLRLLTSSTGVLGIDQIGFSPRMKEYLVNTIDLPHGIFLVTGPTGSGKTTTLYASLNHLDQTRKNIVTIEDPVEYQIPGYGQVQVNEKVGLTFAAGLRSILRQDPDVIMIGEIRDKETAQIAIQSSLTGHMVFSTLHTNDTCATIVRLVDMEIEPYLISSSLKAILAQRLVRKICTGCKESYPVEWSVLQKAGFPDRMKEYFQGVLSRGKGCGKCLKTGYSGRVGIFEFLFINEDIKKQININPDAAAIRAVAEGNGLISMMEDGMMKVLDGITTLDEMLRVVEHDE
ncbi:hypothetical protein CHS0354_018508 [Potamilus streckersoni]|uniref:Bacterial type II secretion system protein E domain-containing protein n=1 Tax=Potamilus streckersoni TaxID=2493646 RepID=A0AAE0TAJ3_9BIVA|nr:hypothetical protein CHS0354_018508 [Potamilus streckersoni]